MMTLRRATLALFVGWYLIAPPSPNNDYEVLVPKAPLSSWLQLGSYTTLKECKRDVKIALNYGDTETTIDFGLFRCVTSDDPRLKQN